MRPAGSAAVLALAALLSACSKSGDPGGGPITTSSGSSTTRVEDFSSGVEPEGLAPSPDPAPGGSPQPGPGPAIATTRAAPPPDGGVPPTTVASGEVRLRGRVATVNAAAGSFVLTEVVSGYRTVVTSPATRYSSVEGESADFANLEPGALVSLTGSPAGGDRLMASAVVFVA